MDYSKFLGRTQDEVLPYVGGTFVFQRSPQGGRRLRFADPTRPEPGWHRMRVQGRKTTVLGPAEAPELDDLPALRGHVVGQWVFTGAMEVHRLRLIGEEELEDFARARGRQWTPELLLFDGCEFDEDAELGAREAFESGGHLGTVKGVSPSLRGAFCFARMRQVAREAGLHFSPLQLETRMFAIARGECAPADFLQQLAAQVFTLDPDAAWREAARRARARVRVAHAGPASRDNAELRANAVLAAAGALPIGGRLTGERTLEVRFEFRGERFVAVVDWETLHVYDSGICLEGTDEQLGLDALPSVIGEAVDKGLLHITRWA